MEGFKILLFVYFGAVLANANAIEIIRYNETAVQGVDTGQEPPADTSKSFIIFNNARELAEMAQHDVNNKNKLSKTIHKNVKVTIRKHSKSHNEEKDETHSNFNSSNNSGDEANNMKYLNYQVDKVTNGGFKGGSKIDEDNPEGKAMSKDTITYTPDVAIEYVENPLIYSESHKIVQTQDINENGINDQTIKTIATDKINQNVSKSSISNKIKIMNDSNDTEKIITLDDDDTEDNSTSIHADKIMNDANYSSFYNKYKTITKDISTVNTDDLKIGTNIISVEKDNSDTASIAANNQSYSWVIENGENADAQNTVNYDVKKLNDIKTFDVDNNVSVHSDSRTSIDDKFQQETIKEGVFNLKETFGNIVLGKNKENMRNFWLLLNEDLSKTQYTRDVYNFDNMFSLLEIFTKLNRAKEAGADIDVMINNLIAVLENPHTKVNIKTVLLNNVNTQDCKNTLNVVPEKSRTMFAESQKSYDVENRSEQVNQNNIVNTQTVNIEKEGIGNNNAIKDNSASLENSTKIEYTNKVHSVPQIFVNTDSKNINTLNIKTAATSHLNKERPILRNRDAFTIADAKEYSVTNKDEEPTILKTPIAETYNIIKEENDSEHFPSMTNNNKESTISRTPIPETYNIIEDNNNFVKNLQTLKNNDLAYDVNYLSTTKAKQEIPYYLMNLMQDPDPDNLNVSPENFVVNPNPTLKGVYANAPKQNNLGTSNNEALSDLNLYNIILQKNQVKNDITSSALSNLNTEDILFEQLKEKQTLVPYEDEYEDNPYDNKLNINSRSLKPKEVTAEPLMNNQKIDSQVKSGPMTLPMDFNSYQNWDDLSLWPSLNDDEINLRSIDGTDNDENNEDMKLTPEITNEIIQNILNVDTFEEQNPSRQLSSPGKNYMMSQNPLNLEDTNVLNMLNGEEEFQSNKQRVFYGLKNNVQGSISSYGRDGQRGLSSIMMPIRESGAKDISNQANTLEFMPLLRQVTDKIADKIIDDSQGNRSGKNLLQIFGSFRATLDDKVIRDMITNKLAEYINAYSTEINNKDCPLADILKLVDLEKAETAQNFS